MIYSLVAFLCIIVLAFAAIPEHKITTLPGWNGPTPTAQYSGYMSVDQVNGKYLHYWFVESQGNPATDPVVLWLNGGPGCSSLDGFFYEHGPFQFVDQPPVEADGIPALKTNPYSWNRVANLIYLEAPAGVGFSYSNNPNDYNTNDTMTAMDNYQFLLNFFSYYPEFSTNQFFITGESYAGIYVPTLVEQIAAGNDAGNAFINLQGFAVGNGCVGNSIGSCSQYGVDILMRASFGLGLYPERTYKQYKATCTDPANPSPDCQAVLNTISTQIGNINIYDFLEPCVNGGALRPIPSAAGMRTNQRLRVPKTFQFKSSPLGGPNECIDANLAAKYVNNPIVREYIHVANYTGGAWAMCTEMNYNTNTVSLLPVYPTISKRYRTLIYSGSADLSVPTLGTMEWLDQLGLPIVQDWTAFSAEDPNQVAGYKVLYDLNGFQFVEITGAGHMAPEYKSSASFYMFSKFLANQPL